MAKKENRKTKGLAAQTTNPESKTIKANFTDNSLHNQRIKLLDYLLWNGSITTTQARMKLDIMHPAGRCKELRDMGYLIVLVWDEWISDYGIKHRIGRYVLTQKEPVERDNESVVAA